MITISFIIALSLYLVPIKRYETPMVVRLLSSEEIEGINLSLEESYITQEKI